MNSLSKIGFNISANAPDGIPLIVLGIKGGDPATTPQKIGSLQTDKIFIEDCLIGNPYTYNFYNMIHYYFY